MRIERVDMLEKYIFEHETVSIDALCEAFNVSKSTIRRDLSELFARGNIRKVYGGVTINNAQDPFNAGTQAQRTLEAKQKIGKCAASLVEDRSWIFLDSGTTTAELIPYLAKKNGVTIVTHSLIAMYEAAKYPSINVYALGGMYSPATSSYVGMSTVQAIDSMNVDTVFIAANGVSLDSHLTNTTYFEAEIKRNVAKCKCRIILLSDYTKFDHNAVFSFCRFNQLYAVVTDRMPPQPYIDCFKNDNVLLITADDKI